MVERVVYVLGAGASFDAGGPLIKDFFSDESERSARVHSEYFDGDEKYSALKAVYDDWAKITQNPNVEGFFKKVEFYDTINKDFEDPRKGELIKPGTLKRWLEWYIAAYVRNSVARQRNPPQYYQQFAGSLKGWGMRYSVITFNYDLVLERAIIGERRSVDYKLGQIGKTYSSGIPFLKLHGSLNWVYCPDCGRWEIYEEPVGHKYNRMACTRKCGGYKERLIVPPNPSKGEYLGVLNELWRKADRLLSQADEIVIIGYSLPEIDISARELLVDSVREVERFEIVNSNPGALQSVARRLGRTSDTPVPRTFKDYVTAICS